MPANVAPASPALRYVAEFERGTPGGPAWLQQLRREAIAAVAASGFPTTKQEEWRFTSVAPIAETVFQRPSPKAAGLALVRSHEICEAHRHLLVFVNGQYTPSLSQVSGLPKGAFIGSLREDGLKGAPVEVIEKHYGRATAAVRNPFANLNTAFADDGAFLYLPPGVTMDEPVQLLYLAVPNGAPIVTHPRNLVVADRESRVSLVETYGGSAGSLYWTNAVTEIFAADAARVDAYRIQRDSEKAYHTGATYTDQARDSNIAVHPVVFGAALSRHDIVTRLGGENGRCIINGLYILAGKQHADHHTTIDHAKPHCESHEYMNGVLDGHSRGVFNGRIIVRPGAQRTDSKQTNNNLVLSEDARADSQPQLEIYADDVKCTHGATLGPIDPKAMFYLTSRGIPTAEARSLLTYGFGAEIIDRMDIAPLQAQLDRMIRQRVLHGALAS